MIDLFVYVMLIEIGIVCLSVGGGIVLFHLRYEIIKKQDTIITKQDAIMAKLIEIKFR